MSLAHELLAASGRGAVDRLVAASSPDELKLAMEPLAEEVLRLLRVDPRQACEVAERAELVAESAGDPETLARSRWVKGHVLSGVSRVRDAVRCYRDAAAAYEELGKPEQVARIAIGQVNALTYLGQYREAIRLGEAARADLERGGETAAAARLDVNLGVVYLRTEQPGEALVRFDRALGVARELGDPGMTRMIQQNRAVILSALGHLDRAERLLVDVRREAEASGELRIRAIVDWNLGYILFQKGEYGLAYDTLDLAREAFESLEDEHYLTNTLIDLTELLIEVNNFERASELASAARANAERMGLGFELGRSTLFQGVAALGRADLHEARASLEEAASVFREEGNRPSEAVCRVYLARVAVGEGNPGEAARLLRHAVSAFRKERMRLHEGAAWLERAALNLARGRTPGAQVALAEAARALRGVASPWLHARLQHLKGRLAEAENAPGRAIRHYRAAVARIESIRGRIGIDEFRISFAENKAPIYADLIEAILKQGKTRSVADAFSFVERARSRALVDLLSGRLDGATAAADPEAAELLDRLKQLRAEINRLSGFERPSSGEQRSLRRSPKTSLVREREAEMNEVMRRLERRNGDLGALTRGETISLAQTQKSLPRDATLVEYYLSSRSCRAFLVRRDGARVVELSVSSRDLARRMAQLRFQIEKGSYGESYASSRRRLMNEGVSRHLAELSEVLWWPLDVPAGRTIVIPHGSLHSLPFAALPRREGGCLIDEHAISYLPSASCRRYFTDDREARERVEPSTRGQVRVLAVDAADASIPEAAREIEHVRSVFPWGETLRQGRATRDHFATAAAGSDVIHIATHGMFRGDDPRFSSLKMADGWMSLYDIYGLKLDAKLVCLSACQSGRNWVGPGDELVGLSRGFLYAGASSLLVSLWPVHDRSTADLMIEFYRRLRHGESLDEALRRAQLTQRQKNTHPYYWAPFVLIGGADRSMGGVA